MFIKTSTAIAIVGLASKALTAAVPPPEMVAPSKPIYTLPVEQPLPVAQRDVPHPVNPDEPVFTLPVEEDLPLVQRDPRQFCIDHPGLCITKLKRSPQQLCTDFPDQCITKRVPQQFCDNYPDLCIT